MQDPRCTHLEVVYRILRYLKSATGKGLPNNKHIKIEGFTDDWVGSLDDRRSTSGYCTFVGGNFTTWCYKKQLVVARSTTEVEYRARALKVCVLLWLKEVMRN